MQSNLNLCRVWKDEIYKFMKNVVAWINCLDLCRNLRKHIFHYDARDYFTRMINTYRVSHKEVASSLLPS